MPELLFELGCEELPAGSVQAAAEQLLEGVLQRLRDAGVGFGQSRAEFTPRRLVVSVQELEDTQPDQEKVQRGPSVSAAYGPEGQPSKALEGFCRSQGIDPSRVTVEDDYVWSHSVVPGKKTLDLLVDILPAAVSDVHFPKTMRWGSGTFRFARPIRWILAVFGGTLVPVTIGGVTAGTTSRGHRFLAPTEFEAKTFEALNKGLRDHYVSLSFASRVDSIERALASLTGSADHPRELIEENANLTEWPEGLVGSYNDGFLELPDPVLVTVMAKHERFFPVRDPSGRVASQFVSIRNGGQVDAVREGNSWVLNARLNDARFFFEEDRKHSLSEFLARTSGMQFQEKLGSVRDRADRLAALACEVAVWSGANEQESEYAEQAGLYAKADLSSGLVSELDELQGVIGGEYARRDGFADPVCWSIATHYDLGRNQKVECVGARTAVRLVMADQLDKLAGFMGIGFAPSGSSDPFGLRRAVTLLIEASWLWPNRLGPYSSVFHRALDLYKGQGVDLNAEKAVATLREVFRSRYESLVEARFDIIDAACLGGDDLTDPQGVRFRSEAMALAAADSGFVQTATRPANIVAAALKKGIEFDQVDVSPETLQSSEGVALWTIVQRQGPIASQAAQAGQVAELIASLKPLCVSIDEFFDSTMVMVDDEKVRNARLHMLSRVDGIFRLAGDFSKIVIDG